MSLVNERTYLPSDLVDTELAQLFEEFEQMLADPVNSTLSRRAARPMLVTGDGEQVPLPRQFVEILQQVAEAMHQGLAVSVVPRDMVLSTQAAADMLGISRPTFVRMLEAGKIPFTQANRHRRVLLQDVLIYQARQRRLADEALDDLVADAQMAGDYEDDFDAVQEAVRQVRKEG